MSDGATSHALTTTPASSANARHERKATTSGGAPSHATATIAASPERIHHVQLEQKRFLLVYAVLIVGTVLTVAMYYVHFEEMWQTIAVALLIAAVKGACVAAVFMHLWHGERDIHKILLYTGVVVAGLFVLSIFSMFSIPGTGHYLR
jgi:caa(3)-type oxidase subunit IV